MAEYRIDLRVVMTAYITADSEIAAMARAKELFGTEQEPQGDDLPAAGGDYIELTEDTELSPAITYYGTVGDVEKVD